MNSIEINGKFDVRYDIINDNFSSFGKETCGDCFKCKDTCPYGEHILAIRQNYVITSSGGN